MWKKAVSACKDLQPPGTLTAKRSPKQQSAALEFARCMRDNGVKDFPDPAKGEPLDRHERIPSTQPAGGMTILAPAMHKCRDVLGAAGDSGEAQDLGAGHSAVVAPWPPRAVWPSRPAPTTATPAAQGPAANTAKVEQGHALGGGLPDGTLTYRARSDGSPYSVINRARGTYTKLPETGDKVDCGDVLYRVDEHPVLLLCGTVPAYRDLHGGDAGRDVRQLNRNLHELGYDADGQFVSPAAPRRRSRRSSSSSAKGWA